MKQLFILSFFLVSYSLASQSSKLNLSCNIMLIGSTNPSAYGLCDGTMTVSLAGCPNPPYEIFWMNAGPSAPCQSLPPNETNYASSIYSVNTLCGCGIEYNVFIQNSTGEQSVIPVVITNPAPTSLTEINNRSSISVFPNPTKDNLKIELKEPNMSEGRFEIVSVLGKVVLSSNVLSETQTVNIRHLSNGIYLIVLYSSNKMVSFKKIIVQN